MLVPDTGAEAAEVEPEALEDGPNQDDVEVDLRLRPPEDFLDIGRDLLEDILTTRHCTPTEKTLYTRSTAPVLSLSVWNIGKLVGHTRTGGRRTYECVTLKVGKSELRHSIPHVTGRGPVSAFH